MDKNPKLVGMRVLGMLTQPTLLYKGAHNRALHMRLSQPLKATLHILYSTRDFVVNCGSDLSSEGDFNTTTRCGFFPFSEE